MNLDQRIFDLIKSMGGEYKIEAGIVTVILPNGEVWDFTEPLKKKAATER